MPLSYILRRFSQKTGIKCYPYQGQPADEESKQYAIDLANELILDLWKSRDLKGSIKECDLLVFNRSQISLPSFIQTVRALREHGTMIPWSLTDIRPRYHRDSWPIDSVRNWRDKGKICIARDVTNMAPPTVYVPIVEDNLSVTIIGATDNSNRVIETKAITDNETVFENSFIEYYDITKNRLNNYNVLIRDADDIDLSLIYNDELKAYYNLIDASQAFPAPSTTPFAMEVLFKERCKKFTGDDNQEFQIPEFDDIIWNLMLASWIGGKGNIKEAGAMIKAIGQEISDFHEEENKGKEMMVEFQEPGIQRIFSNLKRCRRY